MKFAKTTLMGVGAVVLAALTVPFIAPKTVHALAATLVQIANTDLNPVPTTTAVPATPFYGLMTLSGPGAQSVGPGTGTLGVTQIVITNSDSVVNQVNVFQGLLSGGTCGGNGNVEAATNPFLILKVQPNSTLVVPFPTPLVLAGASGYDNANHTCIAASMPITAGHVYVSINGFVN